MRYVADTVATARRIRSTSRLGCRDRYLADAVKSIRVSCFRSKRFYFFLLSTTSPIGCSCSAGLLHSIVLWVKVILLLCGACLVNLIQFRPCERVNHVDFFLLDTTDPLAVVNNSVGVLNTFTRSHHFSFTSL